MEYWKQEEGRARPEDKQWVRSADGQYAIKQICIIHSHCQKGKKVKKTKTKQKVET